MTENETKAPETELETPETPETEPVVDAVAEEQTLLHRIKEAGENGKKEWEQALTKARGAGEAIPQGEVNHRPWDGK